MTRAVSVVDIMVGLELASTWAAPASGVPELLPELVAHGRDEQRPIHVDHRSRRTNVVEQAIARLDEADRLFLVIPPSGTRSRAPHWKSGFYHVARGARVPLVCAFLDYERKVGGIGPVFVPTSDIGADMDRLRVFYRDVRGKYPDRETGQTVRRRRRGVSMLARSRPRVYGNPVRRGREPRAGLRGEYPF